MPRPWTVPDANAAIPALTALLESVRAALARRQDRADLRGASLDGVDLSAATLKRTKLDLAGAVLLAELHGAEMDTAG